MNRRRFFQIGAGLIGVAVLSACGRSARATTGTNPALNPTPTPTAHSSNPGRSTWWGGGSSRRRRRGRR